MRHRLLDHPATTRVAFACVAVSLFAGVVALATYSGARGIGDARLTTKGRAAVTLITGERREVTGVVALHTGETVESLEGAMTIELPDGATVEGRATYKTSAPTRVKIAQPLELLAGDLLVTAKHGTDVLAGGNRVHLDEGVDGVSAARLSRALAVDASVYRGGAKLDSAGQVRTVPALRTMEVSLLGRPPAAPKPLKIDEADPWDRRFLGEAIDLGVTLDHYSVVYTSSIGTGNGRTPGYYRALLPSLKDEAGLTAELLAAPTRPPGEVIVGGAIAGLSRRGSFSKRWSDLFAFKDAGAAWGLVALDQGVASGPLLSEVQNALNASPFEFAAAARTTTPFAPVTTDGGSSSVPPTTGSGGATTTTSTPTPTSPPPPTLVPPPPTLPPAPVPTVPVPPTGSPLVDGVVSQVNQVLGGLLGGTPPG